jgi:hypothetical protein
MRCHGFVVNRLNPRGISVFCEPPQKPINRGVHGERKLLIHIRIRLSDRFEFLFSLFLGCVFTGSVNSVFPSFSVFQFCLLVKLSNRKFVITGFRLFPVNSVFAETAVFGITGKRKKPLSG